MQLKAAIIGCGNIAGGYDQSAPSDAVLTHAKAYQKHPQITLTAAFDPNAEHLDKFCAYWKVPQRYSSVSQLMEMARPDIVSICSPNETHFQIFQTVLEHQPKAIICEKPLALTPTEAEEMVNAARNRGIKLAVNYMRRWDKELTALTLKINRGDFGRLETARVLYTKGVFHNASHGINLIQAWAGKFNGAQVTRLLSRQGQDLLADFSLSFEKAPQVLFQALNADNYNYFEIDLHFTKARIQLPGGGSQILISEVMDSPLAHGMKTLNPKTTTVNGTLGTALFHVVENTVEAVTKNRPLQMAAEEAFETIRICDHVRRKSHE